ncbi:hypothetical protein GH733_017339 [Mirounga leonina]|nr:hypothetical protein GH733_017339 [Mirounga leonina]
MGTPKAGPSTRKVHPCDMYAEAAEWRKFLKKGREPGLICEDLQIPCVGEGFYLQGGWEELCGQLWTYPALGSSKRGETTQGS